MAGLINGLIPQAEWVVLATSPSRMVWQRRQKLKSDAAILNNIEMSEELPWFLMQVGVPSIQDTGMEECYKLTLWGLG